MRKRFVAAVQLTPENEKILIEFFREKKIGWWHRIPNFWLLTTKNDDITAAIIRNNIRKIGPAAPTVLVMQLAEDLDWAGLFPTGTTGTFDWLTGQWAED